MLRTALLLTGLLGLLATAAVAAPTGHTTTAWRGWGLRHRRPSQGDFVPVYATYPYHSRERHGLFGYLHRSNPAARHLGKVSHRSPASAPAHKHTTSHF